MREHVYTTNKEYKYNSLYCIICGGAAGTLTTECPGRKITPSEQEAIYARKLNFFDNLWWVKKDEQLNGKYKIISDGTTSGTKVYSPKGECLGLVSKILIEANKDDDLIFADIILASVEVDMEIDIDALVAKP